jgi:hypothetical protein
MIYLWLFISIADEELSHIKIKSGLVADNYQVTLEVQIYDIFKDYATCTLVINNVSLGRTNCF